MYSLRRQTALKSDHFYWHIKRRKFISSPTMIFCTHNVIFANPMGKHATQGQKIAFLVHLEYVHCAEAARRAGLQAQLQRT